MIDVLRWAAMAWWTIALALLGASTLAGLLFPWPLSARAGDAPSLPLTVIVPIKELDGEFAAAQELLFAQAGPDIEILLASEHADSPAASAALAVLARHPLVRARLVVGKAREAASPKLGNLWASIEQARHDLILTKDSNVHLAKGDIEALMRQLRPGIGLVSAITIVAKPRSSADWIEASAVNGFYARMAMLGRALGLGFGLGKIMLFRRSDLARAGGLPAIAWALGEDSAMTQALARVGLRTVLADRFAVQTAAGRTRHGVWDRLLRWKVIWRVQWPALFAGSLFGSALLAAVAGALAARLIGAAPALVAGATVLVWWGAESLVCAARGWPLSPRSGLAFVEREVLDLSVWLRALTTSRVVWAGATYRSDRPTRVGAASGSGRP